MAIVNESLKGKSYSADTIKKICLDAGADDVGLELVLRLTLEKGRYSVFKGEKSCQSYLK
jgi:hypothetical protein